MELCEVVVEGFFPGALGKPYVCLVDLEGGLMLDCCSAVRCHKLIHCRAQRQKSNHYRELQEIAPQRQILVNCISHISVVLRLLPELN